MRRLGTWLAIVAIALQALWPLLAQAKPRGDLDGACVGAFGVAFHGGRDA